MKLLPGVLAIAIGLTGAAAGAQQYPAKAITFFNNASGAPEAIQRAMFEVVSQHTGATLVMMPRPGAGGAVTLQALKAAAPDGYTFAITYASAINLNPLINPGIGIDPLKDYAPVSNLFSGGNVITTRKDSPVKDFRELVAAAKAKPESVKIGIQGAGNKATLAQIEEATGARFIQVAYRTTGEMTAAVMGGTLDAYFETLGSVLANNQLKGIAYGGSAPTALLPGVPLMRELYQLNSESWWGVVAPAGTSQSVIDWVARELGCALKDPKVAKLIDSNGLVPVGNAPAVFSAALRAELATNEAIVKKYPDVR